MLPTAISPSTAAIRTKQYQERLFWQQESNIPTHVRKRGDGPVFFTTLALTVLCAGFGVQAIANFIKIKA
eukprot:jgi/Hompol1/4299/HPOL_007031-RA